MIFEIKSSENFQWSSNKVKSGYCVRVRRNKNDKGIEFMIGNILPRNIDVDLKSSKQFLLLTKYLEYKGDAFQDLIYSIYLDIHTRLGEELQGDDPDQFKYHAMFHKLLNIFDYEDVVKFLKDVYKLKPLEILPTEFNPQIQKDEDGTREQTYTRDDYIQLVGLIIIIKASYMVLGHIAYLSEDKYNKINSFIKTLAKFYNTHEVLSSIPPMVKLTQFTEKLYFNPKLKEEELLAIMIKKGLSNEEVIETLVAQVIFHKLTLSTVVDDNNEVYIISTMFKFVTNKIKPQDNNGQTVIGEKTNVIISEDSGERESTIENYTMQTDLNPGDIIKVNWCTESMNVILPQLHPYVAELALKGIKTKQDKVYTLEDIKRALKSPGSFIYQDQSIFLLHPIFKGVLDQRLFDYLEAENMINLMTIGIVYMWNLGFPRLASLVASVPVEGEDKMVTINIGSGRSRLNTEILDKLYKVFPLYRAGKKEGEREYNIRRDIESYCNNYYKGTWHTVLSKELVIEAFGSSYDILPVPDDLKVLVGEFLLENEKYAYREIK